MIFNSIPFVVFLLIVFAGYWIIGSGRNRLQNYFLLFSSLFFYAWWDFKLVSLLIGTICISYFAGKLLFETKRYRSVVLFISACIVLTPLIIFKYYNFFVESFASAFSFFGRPINVATLKFVLPLGISFYTFRILSYLFDVYYYKIKATKNFVNYSLYVSFFPQLASGPIEKSASFLSQLEKVRPFNYSLAVNGMRLILFGLFKKIVIADSLAIYADNIFENFQLYPGSVLLIGGIYFAVQIYADFSGYSDIAIGVGNLLGFETNKNFNFPFFANSITDFWRKWHISLTTWFNDYVFMPLCIKWRSHPVSGLYIAILITFILSGLWHGPAWNYVLFGAFHGGVLIFENHTKKWRKRMSGRFVFLFNVISRLLTILVIFSTFVLFRSESVSAWIEYMSLTFSSGIFLMPFKLAYIPLVLIFLTWEFMQYSSHSKWHLLNLNRWMRWGIYVLVTFSVLYFYGQEAEFYYFQF